MTDDETREIPRVEEVRPAATPLSRLAAAVELLNLLAWLEENPPELLKGKP